MSTQNIRKGSFVKEIFQKEYQAKLGVRKTTFRAIFEYLEQRGKTDYLIVETGCARPTQSWDGDGQSTLMFDRFVNFYGGQVHTVDIDPDNCAYTRERISPKTQVHCSDSVKFLWNYPFEKAPDLLYLDSFDLDTNDPHPSALHHVKELLAVIRHLNEETIIVIDDNITDDVAKGKYVNDFMLDIGATPVFKQYQIAWQLKKDSTKKNTSKFFPQLAARTENILLLRVNNYNDILSNWDMLDVLKRRFNPIKITAVVDPADKSYGLLQCDDRIREFIEINPSKDPAQMFKSLRHTLSNRNEDATILVINRDLQAIYLRYLCVLALCPGDKYILSKEKCIKLISFQGFLLLARLLTLRLNKK
jgi:hypothetical protein